MFATLFSHQNLALRKLKKLLAGSNSEHRWSSDPRAKHAIHALELMIGILGRFVGERPMWQTGDLYLERRLNVAFILGGVILRGRAFEDVRCYGLSSHFGLVRTEACYDLSSFGLVRTEVVSFINSLLDDLNDILRLKAESVIHFKEQIEALQEKLLVLRNCIGFPSEICIQQEFLVNLVTSAEALVLNVACVLYFILLGKMKVEKSEKELSDVQKLVYVIRFYLEHVKASRSRIIAPFVTGGYALGNFDSLISNLRNESKSRAYFEVDSEKQFEILLQGLSSVRCYIEKTQSHDYKEGLDNFRAEFLDLIVELGLFSCSNKGLESEEEVSNLPGKIWEENVSDLPDKHWEDKVSNLLDKIQFIKSASGALLIPTSWQYDFPKTNELGFIDFILVNLRERLQSSMISADLRNYSIDTVYDELVSLRHDLGKMVEFHKENEEVRVLFAHYKNVAYQAEYFFDLSFSAAEFSVYQRLGLTGLRESTRQIRGEVKAITTKKSNDNLVHNIANSYAGVSLEDNSASIDVALASKSEAGSKAVKATDQLVGLEDEIETLKEQLTGGSEQLNILSIVGMAGIGKTTLATSVYEDPEVILRFHARAWCSVSQVSEKENLLLEISRQIQRETKQVHGKNDEDMDQSEAKQVPRKNDKDLEQKVYQSLKGRRYLVILDDIWDIAVWKDLSLSFPDDRNGSRVMFTTRNHEVALQANTVPHVLRLLADEESWKLLRVKVFKEETCPTELWQVGKKMAENCKGLPLAVDLIAGVLRTAERRETCWRQVAKQLRTFINDYTSGQQLGTLELSYMHLPDYLKPCFLYFGVFPEDAEIPVHKLVCLWVGEGFIQPKGDQNSLEYEAENYLNALIHRSLIISAKRSSRGGVKTCRIHDLVRDFCLVRAKEEKFLLEINRYDKLPTFRISEMHEQYRLCVYSIWIPLIRLGYFESRVRTLFLSGSTYGYQHGICSETEYPFKIIGVVEKFRLLRVLDLAGSGKIGDQQDFIIISRLVYLRYLAFRVHLIEIPAEVAHLKNLETFIVRGKVMTVSLETIWIMKNLRHLHIDSDVGGFYFRIDDTKVFEGLWQLESLRTLSIPTLWYDKNIEKMMRYLPNLQTLKCTFLSWDHSKSCNQFPVLDFLNRLESLKVIFLGKGQLHPCNRSFPLSIKKLTLIESHLPWNDISLVGRLPNLEVLKLRNAFRGPEWNMKDEEFHRLKYLKLCSLDIARWNASSEHLPHLEELVLEYCLGLEEIPSVLGEAPTLRSIHVKRCNPNISHVAKQIEEEQREMGNGQFNVFIFGDQKFMSSF